ncbi:hypothetical protein CCP4SC76_5850008 [Gammaproteobacteria bacterium]
MKNTKEIIPVALGVRKHLSADAAGDSRNSGIIEPESREKLALRQASIDEYCAVICSVCVLAYVLIMIL